MDTRYQSLFNAKEAFRNKANRLEAKYESLEALFNEMHKCALENNTRGADRLMGAYRRMENK